MAGDLHWSSVVLAMHMDGADASTAFTDQKGNHGTAFGNTKISTASFLPLSGNGSSARFDGVGDYVSIPDLADLNFGAGDFTISLACNLDSVVATSTLIGKWTADGSRSWQVLHTGGALYFKYTTDGTTQINVSAASGIVAGAWGQIEVCRSGASLYLRVDGNQVGTTHNIGAAAIYTSAGISEIGSSASGTQFFATGYIDEVLVTKGVARHTSDFVPPTTPFPNTFAQLSGTVKSSGGAFAARTVRAHLRDTGEVRGTVVSDATTGVFVIDVPDAAEHYVICLDAAAENALIYDLIIPT